MRFSFLKRKKKAQKTDKHTPQIIHVKMDKKMTQANEQQQQKSSKMPPLEKKDKHPSQNGQCKNRFLKNPNEIAIYSDKY